jgi:hypothetical protein
MTNHTTMSRRRCLLAGVPAIAVAMAPAAATALGVLPSAVADDPIFAAIDALKKADHEYTETYLDYEGDSWRDAYPDLAGVYDAACLAMAETVPTTVAGAAALLGVYCDDDPWFAGSRSWHEPALRNLPTPWRHGC